MELRYERLTNKSKDLKKIKNTFETSFPPEERPPFKRALSWENSSFYAVYHENEYVGLVDVVEYLDLVYVFFLAIEEPMRGRGIGAQILSDLKRKHEGKRLYLLAEELDPKYENYEERKHRFGFYKRNGFLPSGVFINEFGVRYEMLIASKPVTKEEFVATMTYLIGEKMARKIYKNV